MTDVQIRRRRGRPPSFDRGLALQHAMEVFWAHGYDGATIPALASAMGISVQSLYAAFSSKESLYHDAMDRYVATVGGFAARAFAKEADAIDAISRALADAAESFSRFPQTPGCMIVSAPAGVSDTSAVVYGRRLRATSRGAITERLAEGVRCGQVRDDTDCAAWGRFINGIVQGMSIQARDGAPLRDLKSTADLAITALQALRPGTSPVG